MGGRAKKKHESDFLKFLRDQALYHWKSWSCHRRQADENEEGNFRPGWHKRAARWDHSQGWCSMTSGRQILSAMNSSRCYQRQDTARKLRTVMWVKLSSKNLHSTLTTYETLVSSTGLHLLPCQYLPKSRQTLESRILSQCQQQSSNQCHQVRRSPSPVMDWEGDS